MDNNLINNRPKELFDIEYYTELPQLPFEYSSSIREGIGILQKP